MKAAYNTVPRKAPKKMKSTTLAISSLHTSTVALNEYVYHLFSHITFLKSNLSGDNDNDCSKNDDSEELEPNKHEDHAPEGTTLTFSSAPPENSPEHPISQEPIVPLVTDVSTRGRKRTRRVRLDQADDLDGDICALPNCGVLVNENDALFCSSPGCKLKVRFNVILW